MRTKVLITIYACYTWRAIRNGYIESCRKEYPMTSTRLGSRQCGHDSADRPPKVRDELRTRQLSPEHKRPDEQRQQELDESLADTDFDCPLPQMPKLVRLYQVFSTIFVTYSTIKYALLSIVHYQWLRIDPIYACYLPGRIGIFVGLVHDVPWFGLLVFGCHVVWRYIWSYRCETLQLDCLLFLLYDKHTIIDKQLRLPELNDPYLPPEAANRIYVNNRIFYSRRIVDGQASYQMRQHRTLMQYERLEKLDVLSQLMIASVCVLCVTAYTLATYAQFDNDLFDANYQPCRSFSDSYKGSGTFAWSFNDRFRLIYHVFDMLDNLVFIIDAFLALIYPFCAALIICNDITLRFDILCKRMANLSARFSLANYLFQTTGAPDVPHVAPDLLKQDAALAEDTHETYNEVIDTFEQIEQVDEFIRRLTSFTICVWFSLTMSIQLASLGGLHSAKLIIIMVYIAAELYLHVLLSCLLMLITRPHHRSRTLYGHLCTAMALCPVRGDAVVSWPWLLEYYHERSSRHSLHLVGRYHTLCSLNVLRCMSWFISGTLFMLHLIKERLLVLEWV